MSNVTFKRLSGTPPFDEEKGRLFKQITKGLYDFPQEFWYEVSDTGI